ncbi:MAG TPA: hypothetical protein VGC66_00555 [Pyrinomonadaceae bacterium]|jgi:hypothetical protein
MTLQALSTPRFVRKTQLGPNEYRKNFHQIDREVMAVVTSSEADQVTPLMSKIYLRLVNAPERFWEREGVLRIEAELRDEKLLKAWAVLCDLVGVASATASKAIQWMHEQGIIGYFSGKNGVGLRIFLNRAVSSIGVRQAQGNKKILAFPPASSGRVHGSANEPAFNDSFAVREVSDSDINPGAPKNGADNKQADKTSSDPTAPPPTNSSSYTKPGTASLRTPDVILLDDVVARLKAELEPAMHTAARQAAAREHERTREWLENRGLPKAARVAQHEAYNVLRKYGVISEAARNSSAHAEVGRSYYTPPEPHRLSPDEITDMAGVCVAMLETKGQSIDLTLSEMSTEAGGFLLPEDAGHVREKANSLLSERTSKEGK